MRLYVLGWMEVYHAAFTDALSTPISQVFVHLCSYPGLVLVIVVLDIPDNSGRLSLLSTVGYLLLCRIGTTLLMRHLCGTKSKAFL